eukprot:COSAG02_NODE_7959_length_2712_cov_4.511602_2_plen_127_part_00
MRCWRGMGGGASTAAAIGAEREKAAREIATAREAAAAQENRVDELQSQLESERARSAGLEIQLKQLEAGGCLPACLPMLWEWPRSMVASPVAYVAFETHAETESRASCCCLQDSTTPSSRWRRRQH